jgi:hypothetical protein
MFLVIFMPAIHRGILRAKLAALDTYGAVLRRLTRIARKMISGA